VRVDEPDETRRQNRDEDDRNLRPVGPEESHDPPERLAPALPGDRRRRGAATERPATEADEATPASAAGAGRPGLRTDPSEPPTTRAAHGAPRSVIARTPPRSRLGASRRRRGTKARIRMQLAA